MRRRVRRSIEAPDSSAPNRSGEGAPASPHPSLGSCSSPAGRPAVRDGAARERGRRRSAYEAPDGSVAPGPASSGAESKRRPCPRSRARQSRLALRRRAARLGLRPAAGCDAVEGLLPLAPLAELARRPAVLAHVLVRELLRDPEPVRGLAVAPLAEASEAHRVRALGARAGIDGALPDALLRRLPEQEVAEHLGLAGSGRPEVIREHRTARAVAAPAAHLGQGAHQPHPLRRRGVDRVPEKAVLAAIEEDRAGPIAERLRQAAADPVERLRLALELLQHLVARGQELDARDALRGPQAGAHAEGELVASLELEGGPEIAETPRRQAVSLERLERLEHLLAGHLLDGLVEARADVVEPGLRSERALPGAQRVGRVLVAPVLPEELHVVGPYPEQVRVAVHVEEEQSLGVPGVREPTENERRTRQGAGVPAGGRPLDGLPL